MELSPLGVTASSGTLRAAEGTVLPHAWSEEGVVAAPTANGAQLLHLAVAFCVLNDTYREARAQGIQVDGVLVQADGAFDADWRSTGIRYWVTIDSPAPTEVVEQLCAAVDDVAEVPRAVRAGAEVSRVPDAEQ